MIMSPARLEPVSDCTANYRPVLSSERAPYIKNQGTVRLKRRTGKVVMRPKIGPDAKIGWSTDRQS
jgi:hypothetical protein